ncbi:hypothetical protein [Rivularia sp. UHCC 0363]|uniref:hypothetical protein n=1 Tax=Rivularia sp. UHCC 0363 TaxID=3110244 RepID=UPI002B2059AA|nr:hypothetical protein [Rivularia sp. UHCC 0363]MEA5597018.1 hypothetical protein [Rivularia sp. UHCC 0363]
MTQAAQLLGCKIYYIPRDFERCETAENALWIVIEVNDAQFAGISHIPHIELWNSVKKIHDKQPN